MLRRMKTTTLIFLLLCLSVLIYMIQYALFHRPEETAFYFLEDLGFVPISVLTVTLGVNTVLTFRDRQAILEKIQVVVSEFYAEAGTDLIADLRGYIGNFGEISEHLQVSLRWTDGDFKEAKRYMADCPVTVGIIPEALPDSFHVFEQKRSQFLHLFENANLMEHDAFTDMLQAVYHVYDELRSRKSFDSLPDADLRHLGTDVERASRLLILEWIEMMRVMKDRYPYLFSLAVRKSPFGSGNVIVNE